MAICASPNHRGVSVVIGGVFVLALVYGATIIAQRVSQRARPANEGFSETQLADGRWLVLGGTAAGQVQGSAVVFDRRTGVQTPILSPLNVPRAWHTAVLLPTGQVLILGGIGQGGVGAAFAELFDPSTETFQLLDTQVMELRAGHTATLLTDGRVLVAGGQTPEGRPLQTAEIWDSADPRPLGVGGRLRIARAGHRAGLLSDGRVLLSGGEVPGSGRAIPEVFDPGRGAFEIGPGEPDPSIAAIAVASPADGALDVPSDVRPMVRFSQPIVPESLTSRTVALTGPDGPVSVRVVPAEGGRLLFVSPLTPLLGSEAYTLSVAGAVDAVGRPTVVPSITLVTARPVATPSDEPEGPDWSPETTEVRTWRTRRPPSSWESLPPLQARPGVTALAGQVLRLDGRPLPNVTLRVDSYSTRTDRTGRFLLEMPGASSSNRELVIDGRTANRPRATFGLFEVQATPSAGQTTALAYTVWMPKIDTVHAVRIASW
jgi:hypothetical protein